MIWSTRQAVLLFDCALAPASGMAWLALAARSPCGLCTARHSRRQPLLHEQELPRWLAALARAVPVLALAALGLATLLDCGDGSQ